MDDNDPEGPPHWGYLAEDLLAEAVKGFPMRQPPAVWAETAGEVVRVQLAGGSTIIGFDGSQQPPHPGGAVDGGLPDGLAPSRGVDHLVAADVDRDVAGPHQ